MGFREASIYAREAPEVQGLRVLITRLWPRGVRKDHIGVWVRDAAPSWPLVAAYRHGDLNWQQFEMAYRTEILDQRPWVLDQLRTLEREHGTLTLLCYERQTAAEHCHRQTLLAMLLASPDAAPGYL